MRRITLIAAASLALVAGGVAWAAIPAANGTFTACVKSDGTLRLIDAEAGATCKASERTVTWSQTGPAGPPGPQGPQGPPGPSGGTGYEVVYENVHYDPLTDAEAEASPWVFMYPVSEVVDCPGSKRATNGGVVDATADPDMPGLDPSGNPMRQPGFDGRDENELSKGPFDPETVPFDPPQTQAYSLPSRPTEDGSGWVVVGFLHPPGFGDLISTSSPHQFFGATIRFYVTCVNA